MFRDVYSPFYLHPFILTADTSLSNYVDNMLKPQSLSVRGNETLYWFGDNNYTIYAPLFAAYDPPKYSLPRTAPAYSFGVAGAGTGVPFHWHGPVFAEVKAFVVSARLIAH